MNEELHRKVVEMRSAGMKWADIAEATGYSKHYLIKLRTPEVYDKQKQAVANAQSRRPTGTCIDCGGKTSYNSATRKGSVRCQACAIAWMKETDGVKARLDSTRLNGGRKLRERQKLLFKYLATGPKLAEQIRDHIGAGEATSVILAYYVKTGRIEHPAFGIYRLPREK